MPFAQVVEENGQKKLAPVPGGIAGGGVDAEARALAGQAKTIAEAALPISGGAMTGALTIGMDNPVLKLKQTDADITQLPVLDQYSGIHFVDQNSVNMAMVESNYRADGSSSLGMIAYNRNADGSNVYSILRSIIEKSGTGYATCYHPRANNYGNDIVTMKSMKDYALNKLVSTLELHVNSDSSDASDTDGLNEGRGLSEDMPFLTPVAAINFINSNYANSSVFLTLHSDVAFSSLGIGVNPSLYGLYVRSDSTRRKITTTGISVNMGMMVFDNIDFHAQGASIGSFLTAISRGPYCVVRFDKNCSFTGTVTGGTVNASFGGIVYCDSADSRPAFSGSNVTGPRYSLAGGSRIFTRNAGENYFPGTTAGTKDASSVYC